MDVRLERLHEYQEFLSFVVEILNNEWPRSETARLRSLTDSRDDLPCCLLLLTRDSEEKTTVIGQSKLTKVHGRLTSVYIENVVIHKAKRGHGYGKKLMELSEDYAQKLGYKTIHLSTHDKCKFYEHLGYQYSSPVSPVRENAKMLTPEQFSVLQSHFGEKINEDNKTLTNTGQQIEGTAENYKELEEKSNSKELSSLKPQQDIYDPHKPHETTVTISPVPTPQYIAPSPPPLPPTPCIAPSPPPVPPLPSIAPSSSISSSKGKDCLYWMVKTLS